MTNSHHSNNSSTHIFHSIANALLLWAMQKFTLPLWWILIAAKHLYFFFLISHLCPCVWHDLCGEFYYAAFFACISHSSKNGAGSSFAVSIFYQGLSYDGVGSLLGMAHTVGTVPDALPPPRSFLISSSMNPHRPNVKSEFPD